MKTFRTYQLAVEFYHAASALMLKTDAKDQLTRASRSIALNLAEGRGRSSRNDQLRFFRIAMGSLRECQALLDLEGLESTEAGALADKIGGSLYRLIERAR